MSYYISANDDAYSDDLLDKIGYIVGLIVALIGLFIVVVSILNMAPQSKQLLGLEPELLGYNGFMRGIGLILSGMVIFYSDSLGVPIILPGSLGLIFTNHKFIRVFKILSGIFIILLYSLWTITITLKWIF